uniref:Ig-like domain-containing protein n=1 Tax=Terrapene triunguis TaxID=2587831 RepID=A0A674JV11_9SAUR
RLEISFPPLRTRFVSPPLTACFFVNPEGSLPKPSISVSPGGVIPVGGNVTIRCRHQRLDLSFLLYKDEDGNYLTYTDPAGSEAEFPITSARREHGGSYTCRYHDKSGIYSKHSDPVQIIVAGEGPAHPTGVTAPGAEVTIQCQGQRRDVRFFLHKAGDLNPQRNMDPAGDGAEFRIPTVGRQHGGSYSCSYRPQSEPFVSSQPSDPVELVVGSYPKPSISVSPGGVIPMGGNVIIRCRHQRLGLRFHLYKAGDGNYLTYTDPAGSEAEFPLTSVRWEHGGSYTCRYTYRAGGVAYSEPSDPVQIIVAAGPLGASASPRPSREDTQAEMGEEGDRVTGGSPAPPPWSRPHSNPFQKVPAPTPLPPCLYWTPSPNPHPASSLPPPLSVLHSRSFPFPPTACYTAKQQALGGEAGKACSGEEVEAEVSWEGGAGRGAAGGCSPPTNFSPWVLQSQNTHGVGAYAQQRSQGVNGPWPVTG